jgi:hypothetical protein
MHNFVFRQFVTWSFQRFLMFQKILRKEADNSFTFLIPCLLFAAQPKEFFLDGLKTLEQRTHKCVELKGEYVE